RGAGRAASVRLDQTAVSSRPVGILRTRLTPVKKKASEPAMAARSDKDAAGARPDGAPPATTSHPTTESTDLAPVVGSNLRRLRTRRGLSLERLAQISGVSRAMLGQIELGQSAPTINVLWKIARALEVT